jgi:hypothetical protein
MKTESRALRSMYIGLPLVALFAATSLNAQKKKINQDQFSPLNATKVSFTPYSKADFTKDTKASESQEITLPNKKKMKLGDYISTLNRIEGNLSNIGFSKNRTQKTVVASRFRKASFNGAAATNTVLPKATVKPANTAITAKFVTSKNSQLSNLKSIGITPKLREEQVNALPNEPFDRTHHLTPPAFRNGDYAATLDVTYYLKGEVDPFFADSKQLRMDSIRNMVKETNSVYTAGLNITVGADVPELGNIVAYKLETEFTARSNKSKKHSSKAKLMVMQQVLINENTPNRNGDASTYKENKLYNINKLIGSADVFTYGINALMPVDFYMSAGSIGADIDVDMTRTGISGSMGPRAAQSIFLETSATEMASFIGEGISGMVDAGVGGELRLVEGGFDYGFKAGLNIINNRLAFENDMQGEIDLELLRGRLFTFYKYPVFVCDNIFLQFGDVNCWEMRTVENDLFNTGAALKFEKVVVNEDRSAYVKW